MGSSALGTTRTQSRSPLLTTLIVHQSRRRPIGPGGHRSSVGPRSVRFGRVGTVRSGAVGAFGAVGTVGVAEWLAMEASQLRAAAPGPLWIYAVN